MVTRRVRSEYMKRFREPHWDSFSRCYEDCVRYRVSRRLLEATHLPWGWDPYSSSSSGCSTPRGGVGGVQDPEEEVLNRMMELRTSSPEPSEGGAEPVVNGFHGDTDNGPMDSISSSDGEVLQPRRPRPRQRPLQAEAKPQRGPRKTSERKTSERKTSERKTSEPKTSERKTSERKTSEPKTSERKTSERKTSEPKTSEPKTSEPKTSERKTSEPKTSEPKTSEPKTSEPKTSERKTSERKTSERKTSERKTRAKSQPPSRTRDQDQSRLDWTQRHTTPNKTLTSDPCPAHMRRSRSAELLRKKQTLSVTYDPWVTEYMHCFSARV